MKIISKRYSASSPKWKKILGKSKVLEPVRNIIFRKNSTYREISSQVHRKYLDYTVDFTFFASIQVANKAKKRGIENTLLRSSIFLIKKNL